MGSRNFRNTVSAILLTTALALLPSLAALVSSVPSAAWAIDPPLHDPSGLNSPEKETLVRVTTARVLIADYDLLKHDFPELANLSHDQIDQWILDKTAYISKSQASQEKMNTPIQTDGHEITAYRPSGYGRGIVFDTSSAGLSGGLTKGLIDAKGTGSFSPEGTRLGNGLASLGEAFREFIYEKLVTRVLQNSHSKTDTVRAYAAVDYGFDIRNTNGTTMPAGYVLRQAHDRSTAGSFSGLGDDRSLEVERILRAYGITSAGAEHQKAVEKINVQGTRNQRSIVDFGAFLTVQGFSKPAMNFDGGPTLLDPKSPDFVQPNPEIQIPFNLWGYTDSGRDDPKFDNPSGRAHEFAQRFRDGNASRADAEALVRQFMDPVESNFAAHPNVILSTNEPTYETNGALPVAEEKPVMCLMDRVKSLFRH